MNLLKKSVLDTKFRATFFDFGFSNLWQGLAQNFGRNGIIIIRLHRTSSLLVKLGKSFIAIINLVASFILLYCLTTNSGMRLNQIRKLFLFFGFEATTWRPTYKSYLNCFQTSQQGIWRTTLRQISGKEILRLCNIVIAKN